MSTLQMDRDRVVGNRDGHDDGRDDGPPSTQSELTERELVVLLHLLSDATLAEIAGTLFVSRNTVKSQVRSVYRKIGASTRSEAISWAYAAGLH